MSKILIIGGVAAGAGCAARLRRLDERSQIIMLERGEYISYANCGLPYHVGDVIQSRDALLVTPVQVMRERFNVDVRTRNEALAIDRENKTVRIKNHVSDEEYTESYDKLVIATGSSPLRPRIPGIDSPRILTLWTVPDTDHIRSMIREHGAKRAVVVGGGFIGLEMAENLHHAGLSVSIVEATDQVMAPVDPEMAAVLHENIRSNGVGLHLSDGVASFEDKGSVVDVKLSSGKILTADIVILSIGVRANSQIAKEAGLELNARGGIIVNDHLQTSDPDIYAAGDVIEVEDFISRERTMVPLAGPANKQGRIVADNLAGIPSTYKGTQGSSVAQVFDMVAASTGANEKTLLRRGLVRDKDYTSVIISQGSHAGYYPGSVQMFIKLLFSVNGAKIFGAQIVGEDGVDKRIDTIGTAIRLGASVLDLKDLELAYAPPFSSAKDPVNMAGFTAENVLNGIIKFSDYDIPEDGVILDIREEAETIAYELPNAVHIPLGQLRDRIGELDRSARYIVFCAAGVRSYNAARILLNHGFDRTELYPGGTRLYRILHPESESASEDDLTAQMNAKADTAAEAKAAINAAAAAQAPSPQMFDLHEDTEDGTKTAPSKAIPKDVKKVTLHCDGMQCPGPIMEVFRSMKEMEDGQLLEVTASDPGFTKDIASWCRRTGNTLISSGKKGRSYVALIQKGIAADAAGNASASGEAAPAVSAPAVSAPAGASISVRDLPQGKTIIVFDGELDKVLASFVIANGALAMGRPVTMFFTFWGLTALRKTDKTKVRKTPVEKMFGTMLPRGTKELGLSRMNMAGMGTKMMRAIMKDKNIDSLEDMMKKAMENGVKIIACSMSMDVMGIKKEELIDGVEIGGVGTYLADAEESNVNLFI